jgi:hypothetical protein
MEKFRVPIHMLAQIVDDLREGVSGDFAGWEFTTEGGNTVVANVVRGKGGVSGKGTYYPDGTFVPTPDSNENYTGPIRIFAIDFSLKDDDQEGCQCQSRMSAMTARLRLPPSWRVTPPQSPKAGSWCTGSS